MNNLKLNKSKVIVLFFAFIFSQIIGGIAFLLNNISDVFEPFILIFNLIISYGFLFTFIYFYLFNKSNVNIKENINSFKISKIKYFILGFLLFISIFFIAEIINSKIFDENFYLYNNLDEITGLKIQHKIKDYIISNKQGLTFIYLLFDRNPIISLISIGIIAPILEELFFRKILFKGILNNNINKPYKAIFISSLLFSIAHFNPIQILASFLLGSCICFIYYKTNSLLFAMFLHVFNNFTIGIIYIFYNLDNIYTIIPFDYIQIFISLLLFSIIITYLFLIIKPEK